MRWYSDDEAELGPAPIIASLTKELRYKLNHGSWLVMKSNTQTPWSHAIMKEREPVGARINLTFRRIFNENSRAK